MSYDPSHPDRIIYARYTHAAADVLADSPAVNRLNFGTKVKDTHGMVTTGANWVARMPASGKLLIHASILIAAWNGWVPGNAAYLRVVHNTTIAGLWYRNDITAGGVAILVNPTNGITLPVVTGDTLYLILTQATGAARALHADATWNWVDLTLIRDR